jgi:hypothetical protein
VNHQTARQILSARMDGEHVPARQAEAAAAHVAGCAACRAFADGAARIRRSVRIRAAESVPDLVEPIMAAVATQRGPVARAPAVRAAPRAVRLGAHRPRHRRPWTLAPAAAAALAGLVLGSVLVGGPWQRPADRPVAAAAVVRGIRAAAPTVDAFRARYRIVETGFSSEVPRRTLDMDLAYLAPQRFRLEVHDRTAYPDRSWTPTDLLFVEDLSSTYTSGPSGCPGDLAPGVCPPTRATVTRVTRYSAAAPLPADLVLPIATFGSARGVRVTGTERLDGREVVQVRLSFARAAPLFPFLRVGGEWRPFFDRDRVELWLDATTWVPVRWTVFPSADPERRAWELRFGLPIEPRAQPIMDVRLVSVATTPPDPGLFTIPGAPVGGGPNLAELPGTIGYLPASPSDADGLRLASVVLPRRGSGATPRSVLVYAEGLDYVRIGERVDWTGPGPFGPIDPLAQRIRLPGDGIGYYEPAGEGFGRRLSIHGSARDLYLETNLPRARLLAIASSIPVEGLPLPRSWRVESAAGVRVVRVPVAEAITRAGLPPTVFDGLPDGYVAASAELANVSSGLTGATFHLRQRDTDTAGPPLVFHAEPGTGLPPPSSAEQSRISFAGLTGRWTPGRSLLEWTEGSGYRSLQGDVGLAGLLSMAGTIVSAEA